MSLANAYKVGEVDYFTYSLESIQHNASALAIYRNGSKPFFDYMQRWLHYATPEYPVGQAWPY